MGILKARNIKILLLISSIILLLCTKDNAIAEWKFSHIDGSVNHFSLIKKNNMYYLTVEYYGIYNPEYIQQDLCKIFKELAITGDKYYGEDNNQIFYIAFYHCKYDNRE